MLRYNYNKQQELQILKESHFTFPVMLSFKDQ